MQVTFYNLCGQLVSRPSRKISSVRDSRLFCNVSKNIMKVPKRSFCSASKNVMAISYKFYRIRYLLVKVNNRNTGAMCKICSTLTIKTPEQRH